jgi:cytochrome c biogenesis protein CcmG/thiol:disulfide interchange protein DsbE
VKDHIKALIAILVVIVVIGFWFSRNREKLTYQERPTSYSVLDRMEKEGVPSFELPRLDGKNFSLTDVKGKLAIVNFWASWCNPCVQEFPSFIKLIQHFKGDVVLIAISNDESRPDIDTFLKAMHVPKENIQILWDKDRTVANLYGVAQLPESFLIGKDGKLIRKIVGIDNWATADAIGYFQDILKK